MATRVNRSLARQGLLRHLRVERLHAVDHYSAFYFGEGFALPALTAYLNQNTARIIGQHSVAVVAADRIEGYRLDSTDERCA